MLNSFNDILKEYPLVFVDIGSAGGFQNKLPSKIKNIYKVGFEPHSGSFAELKRKDDELIINKGLYSSNTKLKLFCTSKPQVSSIYEPNHELLNRFPLANRFKVESIEEIDCVTLDSVFKEKSLEIGHFLKLDTQGSELDILKGGISTLQGTIGLQVEVEFIEMYKNQHLFEDVHVFLKDQKFELFDLSRVFWKKSKGFSYGHKRGQLVSGDAIYLKRISSLKKFAESLSVEKEKKAYVVNAILISECYGYMGYGFEIFQEFDYLFDPEEKDKISKMFKGSKKSDFRPIKLNKFNHIKFVIRNFLFKFFRTLSISSQSKDSAGGVGDNRLGNS